MEYILLIILTAILTWALKPNPKEEQCEECQQKIDNRKQQLETLVSILDEKENEHKIKQQQIESLKLEIKNYESDLEIIECGFYEPIFDFDDLEEFKNKIKEIREDQKWEVKHDNVIRCDKDWKVSGSQAKGSKLVKQYGKIMLRSHNSDCDVLISKVRCGDVSTYEKRIHKSRETINKFGEIYGVSIDRNYTDLKIKELKCVYEQERLKEHKKEEQKAIREQMKQEQQELKELEKAKKEAEKEEARCLVELKNAKKLLEKDELNNKLKEKIEKLKFELEGASEKTRKIAMCQTTRAGHVYFISNKSFEDGVVKIGVTRRLNWEDRVSELSNASVAFRYDIHGAVYSEDSIALEKQLHDYFDEKRVNKANTRKEHFRCTIDEIEVALESLGHDVELIRNPVNIEWEETIAIESK